MKVPKLNPVLVYLNDILFDKKKLRYDKTMNQMNYYDYVHNFWSKER